MVVDAWNAAEAYEPYIGRWSRPIARDFVAWLSVPAGARWLDVGCGTGALCEAILQQAQPAGLTGIDRSPDYAAYAGRHLQDARACFAAGDATALPVCDNGFDAVVSGLMLNFVPQPEQAAGEFTSSARPGGIVAAYVWDYADGMQILRHFWDVARSMDEAGALLDEGVRFPTCHPDVLASLFRDAGLNDVVTTALDAPTVFRDFDDYWRPFLGGQGPAPGYLRSLSAERRQELRETLRTRLVPQNDGTIPLRARAWAVKAVK
ncbi:MAG TPA: methyltransferase domain-containing protein [Longimicrobiales bacterium]|nr:methyltransferase domain-containing protein [Longimicrobiales bacterium]